MNTRTLELPRIFGFLSREKPRAFSTFLRVRIPALSRVHDLVLLLRERKKERIFLSDKSFLLFLSRNELPSGERTKRRVEARFSIVDLTPRSIPKPPSTPHTTARPGRTLPTTPSIIIVLLVLVGPTSTRRRRPTIGRRDARRRHGDRPSSTRAREGGRANNSRKHVN